MFLYLLRLLLLLLVATAGSPSISYERMSSSSSFPASSSPKHTYSQLLKSYYDDEGISDADSNHTIIFVIKHDEGSLAALGKRTLHCFASVFLIFP